ncbi:MAG: hypothetical protein ACKVS9_00565 [Phycisphaerae bacterium]
MLSRIACYLSLLEYARRPGGGFHNLMSYQRQWLGTETRGDCQGQAVRALAEVLASDLPDDYRSLARELMDAVVPTLTEHRSLRTQAYVILAYDQLRSARLANIAPLELIARLAAENLVDCFNRSRRPDWDWFESRMTYANAVLPHALLAAAECWSTRPFLEFALVSLDFLDRETKVAEFFWPIGNAGWFPRGENKAPYDQQPLEAATMAEAAMAAHRVCPIEKYHGLFRRAHAWFHGRNSLELPLIDRRTGGCCDGLQPQGVNKNQGAESTLAYLSTEVLAREAMALGTVPPVATSREIHAMDPRASHAASVSSRSK